MVTSCASDEIEDGGVHYSRRSADACAQPQQTDTKKEGCLAVARAYIHRFRNQGALLYARNACLTAIGVDPNPGTIYRDCAPLVEVSPVSNSGPDSGTLAWVSYNAIEHGIAQTGGANPFADVELLRYKPFSESYVISLAHALNFPGGDSILLGKAAKYACEKLSTRKLAPVTCNLGMRLGQTVDLAAARASWAKNEADDEDNQEFVSHMRQNAVEAEEIASHNPVLEGISAALAESPYVQGPGNYIGRSNAAPAAPLQGLELQRRQDSARRREQAAEHQQPVTGRQSQHSGQPQHTLASAQPPAPQHQPTSAIETSAQPTMPASASGTSTYDVRHPPAPEAPQWTSKTYHVTCWGSNKMADDSMLLATVTDAFGNPNCYGDHVQFYNPTGKPIFYGFSGTINMSVAPHATDVVMYKVDRTGPNDKRPTTAVVTVRWQQ